MSNKKRIKEFEKYFYGTKKIKIGLSWKSAGINKDIRYILLNDLIEIFPKDKFEIINLQYGDIMMDLKALEDKEGQKLIYFDGFDYTNDLEGLAGLIHNCDLIVSIGSFTASFSGALGKKTLVLLPANSEWTWHSNTDRKESLWFPNMKILKQKTIHEWEYVFDLIKTEVVSRFY